MAMQTELTRTVTGRNDLSVLGISGRASYRDGVQDALGGWIRTKTGEEEDSSMEVSVGDISGHSGNGGDLWRKDKQKSDYKSERT